MLKLPPMRESKGNGMEKASAANSLPHLPRHNLDQLAVQQLLILTRHGFGAIDELAQLRVN